MSTVVPVVGAFRRHLLMVPSWAASSVHLPNIMNACQALQDHLSFIRLEHGCLNELYLYFPSTVA